MLGSVGTQLLIQPHIIHCRFYGGLTCSFEWHFWVEARQVQLLVAFPHLGRCITSVLSNPTMSWPGRWFPLSDLPLSLLQRSLRLQNNLGSSKNSRAQVRTWLLAICGTMWHLNIAYFVASPWRQPSMRHGTLFLLHLVPRAKQCAIDGIILLVGVGTHDAHDQQHLLRGQLLVGWPAGRITTRTGWVSCITPSLSPSLPLYRHLSIES